MRIFYSFLIIVASVILILLPITAGAYDFRTDLREDNFTVITDATATNSTVQLFKPIYDNDVSTLVFSSNDTDDSPTYYSYNTTTRALMVIGLSANTTRGLAVTYDVDALGENSAMSTFVGYLAWIWILIWIAFPVAGLVAIWTGRV